VYFPNSSSSGRQGYPLSSLYKEAGVPKPPGVPGASTPVVSAPGHSMLRPSFPGGVPYPPRPGEAGVRYAVLTPGAGGAGQPPVSYSSRDPANVLYAGRQPASDVRSSSGAGARIPLRNPPYPLYPGDYRDGVQVLSVGGRPEPGVHVVPPAGSLSSLHPVLEPGGQPPKRPRVQESHPHGLPPLRIDTRDRESKEPGYHPQVEAISPTPDDRCTERDDVRSTKEDLLQKISKVDREIAKAESQIAKLKKKQHELEDAANKPSTDCNNEETQPNQSLAQMVYSDNRRKAELSHAALDKLSSKNALPLYNQPSDTEQYVNNKKNYTVFKKKLVEYFKKAQAEREQSDRNMITTYCKLSTRWNKKIDRIENSRKRKEREAKCREQYEKIFPELRKQREDKERDARLGTRGGVVKSDADFEDVIERLQEQENEDKKMHSYAVIPPLLLPSDLIKRKFTNTNGLIPDPMVIYNDRKYVNMWTDPEKETFREKFLQHPKNFGVISQYLERKSVADCVQYYYLSKKTENYKQLLRKSKIRRSRPPRQQPQAQPPEVIDRPGISSTRPWTRNMENKAADKANDKNDKAGKSVKEEVGKGSRSGTPNNVKNDENGDGNDKETGKKKPSDRAREAAKKTSDNQNDSSDDDDNSQAVKSGPHPCVICNQICEQTRAVSRAQASQLGLKEEELTGEARVCSKCWCNTLKKKHICPVPLCTSSKGRNRAKLRHLPGKWQDLDAKSKGIIMGELQLPEGSKRVCNACFTRITRRISQLDVGAESGDAGNKDKEEDSVSWSEAEIESAKTSLKNNGTNWSKMTELIKTKNAEQCKEFFYNRRKQLQLDKLVTEYKKSRSDKPSLTSDEESGSTTSSCEETDPNSQAASAAAANKETKPEPEVTPAPPQEPVKTEPVKKEEGYDSGATVSADETGDNLAGAKKSAVGPSVTGDNMSVKDMMEMVISTSLRPTATNMATSSQAPSLGNMLEHAPPVPLNKQRNVGLILSTNSTPVAEPLVTNRPDLDVRPVPAPAPAAAPPPPATNSDAGILDLTTSKPARSGSPAVSALGHNIEREFSYPGISRPPPEPVPESRGQAPPPAHGGDAKSKTTHNVMMQESSFPPMFRKDNKSPAPYNPGLIPRGDPRKDIKSAPSPQHPKARPPIGGQDPRERSSGSGSIIQGTPHQRSAPGQAQSRPFEQGHPKGSIVAGHPMVQTKPVSPRGPPPSGRSSQPHVDPHYKGGSGLYLSHHPARPGSEPSPTGQPTSSRDIIELSHSLAKNNMQPKQPSMRSMEPPRRDDPRLIPNSSSGFSGSPYHNAPRPPMRGDPRADIPTIPTRGDPRELHRVEAKDPRDPMARVNLIDPQGRPVPGYNFDPNLRQSAVLSRSQMPGPPSRSSGSISEGRPRQPTKEVEIFPRHPDVIIEKQARAPAPAPPSSRGPVDHHHALAGLAEAAAKRDRIPDGARPDHRLIDARNYEGRSKPDTSRPGPPGLPTPANEQEKILMNKFGQMSEEEKRAFLTGFSQLGASSDSRDVSASSLIEAIITHQINKNTGQPVSLHSPHGGVQDGKESPSKVPSRSPSVKSVTDRDSLEAGSSGHRNSTMGEHIENMINKEVIRSAPSTMATYSNPAPSSEAHEHWKRRGYPPPSDHPAYAPGQRPPGNTDERQILRVAGPGQDRPDKPPSRSSHEAISPPTTSGYPTGYPTDQNMARYLAAARRKDAENAGSSKPGPGYVAHFNDDYLKHKITEMMKNEKAGGSSASVFSPAADLAAKAMSMGPPHKRPLDVELRGSPSDQPNPESPRKKYKAEAETGDAPDSPESGSMVIDETARPDSAHSHKTSSPAPTPGSGENSHAAGYPPLRGQPPRSSPAPGPPGSRPPPANPRYEPLSDDD